MASVVVSASSSGIAVRRQTARPAVAARSVQGRSLRSFAAKPSQARGRRQVVVRAEADAEADASQDVDKIISNLQEKWDGVENKTSVVVYGVGAIALLWFSNTIVGAVNSVPLLPKFMELVGLGYTAWFVYRYLLFKSSREELLRDVEDLKKKIAGTE